MVTFEEIDSDEEKITENLKKLNLTIELIPVLII